MSSARVRFQGVAFLLISLVAVARCSVQCRSNWCKKEAQYLRGCLNDNEDPCQDFYSFACGNFENPNPVSSGSESWGLFDIVQNATNYAVNAILSSPKLSTDIGALKKAKTMYSACMDTVMREQRGINPLLHMIKSLGLGGWPLILDSWNSTVTWRHVAHAMAKFGFPLFFEVSVMPNPYNTSVDIIYLTEPSYLLLPVPLFRSPRREEGNIDVLELSTNEEVLEYFLDVTMEVRKRVRTTHVKKESIKNELLGVLDFARKLQDIPLEDLIFDTSDDIVPIGSLDDGDGQIDWLEFLQIVFSGTGVHLTSQQEVYTGGSTYIKHVLQLFKNTDSRVLANFIVSRLVMHLAPETTERMRGFFTRFHRKLQLNPDNNPSWQYCVNVVRDYPNTGLIPALAHDYVKNNFRAKYKPRVTQMVKDLRVSARELLYESDWMDEETRRLVVEKMEAISISTGFPEWASNVSTLDDYYDKLIIHKDDHFGNVARMRAFLQASNLAILNKKNYPNLKMTISPLVVNAYYEARRNSVTIPAGIMQHPFYIGQDNIPLPEGRKKSPGQTGRTKNRKGSSQLARTRRKSEYILLALDYGRFGSVVGHELTHAFDHDGYLYDKSGQLNNEWSNSSESLFLKNGECFVDQYERYHQDTLNDDIADNGGVRKAFRAFKRAWSRVGGINATLPDLKSFTPEQLFFLGYATSWCHAGEEYPFDNHSPPRDRVMKPLSNMKEFSDAWGCTAGSPMNPRDKCVLW